MTTLKVTNRPAIRTFNGLVNELFNDLEQSFVPFAGNITRHYPAINIIENNDGYHAELLAPGRKKELFAIGIEKNQLTISYEEPKTEATAEYKQIRREFTLGNFKRTFTLDENIDSERIQARYEDGLLKLFLPKKMELKPVTRSIQVQ